MLDPVLRHLLPYIEILILFLLIVWILRFVQETRGSGILRGFAFAFLIGFVILLGLSETLHLSRIKYMLEQWLIPWFAIFLFVIFQPEIRRGLVRIGQNPLIRSVFGRTRSGPVQEITRAVENLSKNRIGAIITICGESGLQSYIEGGVKLNALISRELIQTIFYPGTHLHDGAIIISGDRIEAAGCLLPLADDPDLLQGMGTRHRAGIGITIETDAISIIVSEETGNISTASRGEINEDLDLDDVETTLSEIYTESAPSTSTGS